MATAFALVIAGCGGSGDGSMSKKEVASKVEAACAKLSGYSVWLPEHVEKTGISTRQGEAIVQRAADDFRSTLRSLDPPGDLRRPLKELATPPEGSPESRAEMSAELERLESLYEQVGAQSCAKGQQASGFILDGESVEEAYARVGLPLPPHPDGW